MTKDSGKGCISETMRRALHSNVPQSFDVVDIVIAFEETRVGLGPGIVVEARCFCDVKRRGAEEYPQETRIEIPLVVEVAGASEKIERPFKVGRDLDVLCDGSTPRCRNREFEHWKRRPVLVR